LKQSLVFLKKNIVEAGKRAYMRSYAAAYDGNISARINQKSILITPAGINKGFMKEGDLVVIDMNGTVLSGKKKPSSEFRLHLQIYKERSEVQSVCHLHPPYATGFAAAGIVLDRYALTESEIILGAVPLIEYALPGSEELYKNLAPYLQNSNAFLLANHGVLTVGTDIFDAYNKMETLEHTAHIIFIARQLGNVKTLGIEEVKKLAALRNQYQKEE